MKKYPPQIPILIEQDKVIAENIYQGKGYGLLIGWVNPSNTAHPMAIYTGQNPVDVINFNSMMNGSGNSHIFRNFITFRQGNFSKNGRVWVAR